MTLDVGFGGNLTLADTWPTSANATTAENRAPVQVITTLTRGQVVSRQCWNTKNFENRLPRTSWEEDGKRNPAGIATNIIFRLARASRR